MDTKAGISKKLGKPWTGPYRVSKIVVVTYEILKVGTRQDQKVHVNRGK